MLSCCNHHDWPAPESSLALPTAPLVPQPLLVDCLPSTDLASLHHLRLESSLDSALAALALIHDTAPLTAATIFTPHMTEVLRALCQHATLLACSAATTPAPKCPTPPTNTDAATYAKAAKAAGAAVDHTTAPKVDIVPKVLKPHANEVQHLPSPSLSLPRHHSHPRRPEPPVGRLSPAMLLDALNKTVVTGQIDEGRLPAMWGAIRQTLKYPKSTPLPCVDLGGLWPSVIVHNVPVPTATSSAESAAEDWLRQGGYEGTVQRITPLCSKETLSTKCTVPYRVSLISMAKAEFLVEHGALLFGS
ncbi:hypothetical protein DFH08DRAFT_811062 [Mycena albidolilacea]|uniref:Uncharacterized protein n=1 Tax=Mycena albidolilacea TaxID=1033008 RepID=A0AAD7ENC8_9AGAR|nr:hypothetical protein DFH08DRAFT_811062 [Mycena albidolilacea]